MSKRHLSLLIQDMHDACQKILRYSQNLSRPQLLANSEKMDALYFNFQVIGEVANKLPHSFTEKHPSIEWRKIAALRNRIVHEYAAIDGVIILELVETEIPRLLMFLELPNLNE